MRYAKINSSGEVIQTLETTTTVVDSEYLVMPDSFWNTNLNLIYYKDFEFKSRVNGRESEVWDNVTEAWIVDLHALKINKAALISRQCHEAIALGFTSSALAIPHTYPNNDRDQVNLSGSILRSTLPNTLPTDVYPFLCMDANGAWGYKIHTATQIQQVGADSYNFILAARVKNATLQYKISQATTQEQLNLIVW